MPHKRNPVAAVAVAACTARVPGLVATVLGAMAQEHERAAGGWHAEWEPQRDLLRLVGSAAAWSRELLDGLELDPARMRANLDAAGGLPMAEAAVGALAGVVGRARARELVDQAARRGRRHRPPAAATRCWRRPRSPPPPGPGRGGGRPRPGPVPWLGPGPDRPGPGRPRLALRGDQGRAAPGSGNTASTLARMLAKRRTW